MTRFPALDPFSCLHAAIGSGSARTVAPFCLRAIGVQSRAMKRRLFTIMSALSLALCVNGAATCADDSVPANDHDILSVYCKPLHARYTLRANTGRIGLYGPPLAGTNFARTHSAPARVRRIVNGPLECKIFELIEDPADESSNFFWIEPGDVMRDSLLEALFPPPTRETIPAVLDAMEDPKCFTSAHWLLTNEAIAFAIPEPPAEKKTLTRQPDGSFIYLRDGLHLEFSRLKETARGVAVGGPIIVYSCRMSVDPSQFSRSWRDGIAVWTYQSRSFRIRDVFFSAALLLGPRVHCPILTLMRRRAGAIAGVLSALARASSLPPSYLPCERSAEGSALTCSSQRSRSSRTAATHS